MIAQINQMADETKTAAPTVKKGLKEYASDPAAALNVRLYSLAAFVVYPDCAVARAQEVAAALKDGVSGTPLEDPIRQAAVAAGLDDGLVVLIGCLLFSLITISIFGATNIITWFGFIAPVRLCAVGAGISCTRAGRADHGR